MVISNPFLIIIYWIPEYFNNWSFIINFFFLKRWLIRWIMGCDSYFLTIFVNLCHWRSFIICSYFWAIFFSLNVIDCCYSSPNVYRNLRPMLDAILVPADYHHISRPQFNSSTIYFAIFPLTLKPTTLHLLRCCCCTQSSKLFPFS